MSCGMSPAVFQLIEEMKRKQQDELEKPAASKLKTQKQRKKKAAGGSQEYNSGWDWTKTYNKWAEFEDPEEVEAAAKKEEEKRDAQAKRAAMGGCNHDHSAEREVMEKSVAAKFEECKTFSKEGNAWFQEGQFFRAGERYRKVLVWMDYTFPETPEDEQIARDFQLSAHVNLAVCKLHLGDWDEVLNSTYQALNIDPENVKAMYTKGKVLRLQHKFEEAKALFKKALAIEPMNYAIRRQLALLQHEHKQYLRDSKTRAQAMFSFQNKKQVQEARKPDIAAVKGRVDYLSHFQNTQDMNLVEFEDTSREFNDDQLVPELQTCNKQQYALGDLVDLDIPIPDLYV